MINRKSSEDWVISMCNVIEFYYILGVYFGDGSISEDKRNKTKRMRLEVCDRDFLERFVECAWKIFGYKPKIGTVKQATSATQLVLGSRISNTSLCNFILQITEKKTKIPELVKTASKECKIYFLAGLFDSEGSIWKNSKGYYVSANIQTISEWLYDIQQMFVDIGVKAHPVKKKNRKTIAGNTVYSINIRLRDLVKVNFPLAIKRKRERLEEYKYKILNMRDND